MLPTKMAFARTGQIEGVWLTYKNGDVHFYRDKANKSLVIGHNKNFSIKFTDPAIILNEGGKIYLQKSDDHGQPLHTEIDPTIFAEKLSDFIEQFV
jgi:hypothetical protein